MPDFIAFDTEDDSPLFSSGDAPAYAKHCTQIAAIDARTGERFHLRPKRLTPRRRGRHSQGEWDVGPFLSWLDSRGPVRCYAHNLSYDLGNIWRDKLDELDVTLVGNRLVRARWHDVTLLDSSNIWPMPLAKVGASVGLEKGDMDVESEDYVFRDVEIVVKAMEVADSISDEWGCPPKGTLGSMAVGIWSGPVMGGSNWQCTMPSAREAYYGGRGELFSPGAQGDDLWHVDINSLYPSTMLRPFPASADIWCGLRGDKDLDRVLRDMRRPLHGIVRADVHVPEDTIIAPLPVRREGSGEVLFPVGRMSGWWTIAELRAALARGCRLLRVREGYGGPDAETYYADFVRTFYRLRKQELDKEEPDEARVLFFKLLMNNLYGQLGMRGEVSRSIRITEDMVEHQDDGSIVLLRDGVPFGSKLLADVSIPTPAHVNYMHAAHVTSYGRIALMDYMDKAGADSLIYCDTDSLFFRCKGDAPPFPLSTELGQMKLEGRPRWVECRAPKMYRVADSKGNVKTKAKGVPKKHQDKFYDDGVAEFWQPWRLRESIRSMDRIPDPDEEPPVLSVWRKVMKRVVTKYDKKRLVGGRYLPKTIVDIGPDDV